MKDIEVRFEEDTSINFIDVLVRASEQDNEVNELIEPRFPRIHTSLAPILVP